MLCSIVDRPGWLPMFCSSIFEAKDSFMQLASFGGTIVFIPVFELSFLTQPVRLQKKEALSACTNVVTKLPRIPAACGRALPY